MAEQARTDAADDACTAAATDAGATALLVIDMQRDFCEAGGYADQAGLDIARLSGVIDNIAALLAAARTAGMAVIYTREGHLPDLSDCPPVKRLRSRQGGAEIGSNGPMGRLLIRGEHGQDVIDRLAPQAGEVVIDKPGYGAFHRTGLQQVLSERGIVHLILCGVTTEVCVHSTLREAIDRGYACVTVADACAASQARLQEPALAMIGVEGGIFGQVRSTAELLAKVHTRPEASSDRCTG